MRFAMTPYVVPCGPKEFSRSEAATVPPRSIGATQPQSTCITDIVTFHPREQFYKHTSVSGQASVQI